MQRQSRLVPNLQDRDYPTNTFSQEQSPLILPHASFVGLGIIIGDGTSSTSSGDVTVTVAVGGSENGEFADEVTMEGEGDWRWPDIDGMNRLYNARFVQITWDSGYIQVFQKG